MSEYEVTAQVRMIVTADNSSEAEDTATEMLNAVVIDIEHIEVKP